MSRVFIVRHGNTFDTGDTLLRVGGRTDLPLSISGQKQALALKTAFSKRRFAAAYSSDLLRTKETAQVILSAQSAPPPLQRAEFLREIDYGPDEGQAESDVIARLGQEALTLWDERAVPPADWKVDPEALRRDWAEFLDQAANGDGDILVLTSNGVARFVLDVVVGSQGAARKLRTGAYGVIDATAPTPTLLEWNVRP